VGGGGKHCGVETFLIDQKSFGRHATMVIENVSITTCEIFSIIARLVIEIHHYYRA